MKIGKITSPFSPYERPQWRRRSFPGERLRLPLWRRDRGGHMHREKRVREQKESHQFNSTAYTFAALARKLLYRRLVYLREASAGEDQVTGNLTGSQGGEGKSRSHAN